MIYVADIYYNLNSNELKIEEIQFGIVTDEQRATAKKVIAEAKERFGYIISEGTRFFFIKQYYETEYIKPTKRGLMGQKYFDLMDIKEYKRGMDTKQIAEVLKEK